MLFNYKYTDIKHKIFKHHNKFIQESGIDIDLALFGDSITESFDLNRYGITNKTYINAGIGGDRLPYMYERLERDILIHNPKEVIFMGGVNDLRAWFLEDGNTIDQVNFLVEHTIKYIDLIIKKLTENQIDVKLCTITCNFEADTNFEYTNAIIDILNEHIKTYAYNNQVTLIDYNQVLKNEYGYMNMNLSNDGLHPNEYGYIKMCELIKDHLIK